MLDIFIAKMGSVFVIIIFLIFGAAGLLMLNKWYVVINQAQFTAVSVAKYGGYTDKIDNAMAEFADEIKGDASSIELEVSPDYSNITYGTVVRTRLTYNFRLNVTDFFSIDVPITGRGRAACTALSNDTYGVAYVLPSY